MGPTTAAVQRASASRGSWPRRRSWWTAAWPSLAALAGYGSPTRKTVGASPTNCARARLVAGT
eukprot:5223443-Alexandrium_andersonii.AAC.1